MALVTVSDYPGFAPPAARPRRIGPIIPAAVLGIGLFTALAASTSHASTACPATLTTAEVQQEADAARG
jgi:hypothetical protein